MLFRAERIPGDHLREERVLLLLDRRVVSTEIARLRDHVRRDSRADDADPVLRPVPGGTRRPPRKRSVVRRPERVAECPAGLAEDDRRLSFPPGPVWRV